MYRMYLRRGASIPRCWMSVKSVALHVYLQPQWIWDRIFLAILVHNGEWSAAIRERKERWRVACNVVYRGKASCCAHSDFNIWQEVMFLSESGYIPTAKIKYGVFDKPYSLVGLTTMWMGSPRRSARKHPVLSCMVQWCRPTRSARISLFRPWC